jgi:2-polyprenyl-3-methyl-5-hydroxy-6-metoxy-1,4-benzoquinol methylase
VKSLSQRLLPESMRRAIKVVVPEELIRLRNSLMLKRARQRFDRMSIADTFNEIYRDRMWGEGSGTGSAEKFALAYADIVVSFARKHGIKTVVDVGCGDFRVGRKLADSGLYYIGVDVVAEIIRSHKRRFEAKEVSFECLDVTVERPPAADLCLIRQVLQHLSNAEILKLLNNCKHYARVLITEHLPTEQGCLPNKDKPHGPDTRLSDFPRSGVFLELPPFSLSTKTIFECPYAKDEILRTVLIEN